MATPQMVAQRIQHAESASTTPIQLDQPNVEGGF
jgi:hypothetical protein